MRRIGVLAVVVLFMTWFPMVALAVLLAVAFGWQVPVAFALQLGFMIFMARRPEPRVGRIRAAMEFVGFTLLGGILGGLLLGGLGATFGSVSGFMGRLSQVPVTRGPSFRFARRRRD